MKNTFLKIVLASAVIISAIFLFSFRDNNTPPIKGYQVLEYNDLNKLEEAVKGQFQYGYTCAGGISTYTNGNNRVVYLQAMQK